MGERAFTILLNSDYHSMDYLASSFLRANPFEYTLGKGEFKALTRESQTEIFFEGDPNICQSSSGASSVMVVKVVNLVAAFLSMMFLPGGI
jgi:hypothetical protein